MNSFAEWTMPEFLELLVADQVAEGAQTDLRVLQQLIGRQHLLVGVQLVGSSGDWKKVSSSSSVGMLSGASCCISCRM